MYEVIISDRAQRGIDKIPTKYAKAIMDAILGLAQSPKPHGYKKMRGFKNTYRIRTGTYRIIYKIKNKVLIVEVIDVGHRSRIYE